MRLREVEQHPQVPIRHPSTSYSLCGVGPINTINKGPPMHSSEEQRLATGLLAVPTSGDNITSSCSAISPYGCQCSGAILKVNFRPQQNTLNQKVNYFLNSIPKCLKHIHDSLEQRILLNIFSHSEQELSDSRFDDALDDLLGNTRPNGHGLLGSSTPLVRDSHHGHALLTSSQCINQLELWAIHLALKYFLLVHLLCGHVLVSSDILAVS